MHIYPYRWRGGALILRLLLPVGVVVGLGFGNGWLGLIGLLLLIVHAEGYWAGLTTRRFAALSAAELVVYGAFGRKILCCPVPGTRFRYRQIQRHNSTWCFLYAETATGSKKIDLQACTF